jgi:PKD repeat protein
MDFFGYPPDDDFVAANFNVDKSDISPGETVQFTDFTISDEDYPVTSWAWDFDSDGTVDSEEQNPAWTYSSGGLFDVTLVASNGQSTDTLIRHELILVRSGVLVYEGEENGIDQSGAFIRDYLIAEGKQVVYTNDFPDDLDGFDAVFASFGSNAFTSPVLDYDAFLALKDYLQDGGRAYLEGANALGRDQEGNPQLWFYFGIGDVIDGDYKAVENLIGQPATITEGMAFNSSQQLESNSIDTYVTSSLVSTAHVSFVEEDYGSVAVQFDGSELFGQKTFCMSYSLAMLDDGEFPNTRTELLQRVLNFFDLSTGINVSAKTPLIRSTIYPNPAIDACILEVEAGTGLTVSIECMDITGRTVWEMEEYDLIEGVNRIEMDVSAFRAGTYFYKLSGHLGIAAGKFIISH